MFEAGLKMVLAKFHYTSWFGASSEPPRNKLYSVMEFGYWRDRYCGRQGPPAMTSTENVLSIVFVSDSSIATEGFSASYTTANATSGV